jgi:hypothetical protein
VKLVVVCPHPVVAEPMNPAATVITITDLRSTIFHPSTIVVQYTASPKPLNKPSLTG